MQFWISSRWPGVIVERRHTGSVLIRLGTGGKHISPPPPIRISRGVVRRSESCQQQKVIPFPQPSRNLCCAAYGLWQKQKGDNLYILNFVGKTFIGVEIVMAMLENRIRWGITEPLLVVCYSNHALDQFLTRIHIEIMVIILPSFVLCSRIPAPKQYVPERDVEARWRVDFAQARRPDYGTSGIPQWERVSGTVSVRTIFRGG